MSSIYEKILELSRRGEEGVLVTIVEKEGSGPLPPGAKMLVYADGRTAGTVGGGALELAAARKAGEMLQAKKSLVQRYVLFENDEGLVVAASAAQDAEVTGMVCGGRVTLFFEYLTARPRLYLFGGGHVGQALVYHLRNLGYYVTVIDHRPGIAEALPEADQVILADYEQALQDEAIPEGSFFVIATPSHEVDYLVLRCIFTSIPKPRYVGLVASRAKTAKFTGDLRAELSPDVDLSPLYAPVGLDIGGSNVDEIAIAILAEMQALRYEREGQRHLSYRTVS